MKFQPALSLLFLLPALCSYGQSGDYTAGARSAAMGNTSLTLTDSYSFFNNPAGISQVADLSFFASYENRYLIEDMQVLSAGAVVPFKGFSTGLGFYRFGGKLYNEQMIGIRGADKIGFMSLGVGFNYVQYQIEAIGTRGMPVLDLGGIAELSDEFHVGAHIYNVTQTRLAESSGERLPTIMKLGVSYRPMDKFMINLETLKDINYAPSLKTGLEYYVIPQLALRSGFSTAPFISCFGVGFRPKKFQVDYSFRNDATLGDMHQLSVNYALPGKK